jgi:hypothetical protein
MKKNTVAEIIAALLILLFTYTALSKFFEFSLFTGALRKSPLIKSFAPVAAWLLPVTELVISLLLLIPATRQRGLYASSIAMTVFTLYIGYMLLFIPELPCSCGGVLRQLTWQQHLVFNIFFTMLSITGVLLNSNKCRWASQKKKADSIS